MERMRPGELHGKVAPAPAQSRKQQSAQVHVFTFGKHRGKGFHEVWNSDPGYMRWCCNEIAGFAAKVKAAGIDVDGDSDDIDLFS